MHLGGAISLKSGSDTAFVHRCVIGVLFVVAIEHVFVILFVVAIHNMYSQGS